MEGGSGKTNLDFLLLRFNCGFASSEVVGEASSVHLEFVQRLKFRHGRGRLFCQEALLQEEDAVLELQ